VIFAYVFTICLSGYKKIYFSHTIPFFQKVAHPITKTHMPENENPGKMTTASPQQRAIYATIGVTIIIILFAAGGFWYGRQTVSTGSNNSNSSTANTNTATPEVTTADAKLTINGKVTAITSDTVSLTISENGKESTTQVKYSADTKFRKLDFRSIPKTGIGDGVKITKEEVKVGTQIVVVAAKGATPPNAEKIYVVIYP
jgi:hypothetical protein